VSSRKLWPRFWVTFVLACLLSEGLELLFERIEQRQGSSSPFSDSFITATGLYQRIVTVRRDPKPRFTAIVEIDPAKGPRGVSDQNVCAERAFLAELIERISEARPPPAMIVIDKFFGAASCRSDDAGTESLLRAISHITQMQPVVVGIRTSPWQPSESKDGHRVHVVQERLSIAKEGPFFGEGVINVAPDNRRLALQWRVYQSRAAVMNHTPSVADTLSLAVAKLYDSRLLQNNTRLANLISQGVQPYIGFLKPEQFEPYHLYAGELCSGQASSAAPRCAGQSVLSDIFRNKIVLIGENDSDRDSYPTIVGRVSGFYLQANYIEALLDDRFYTPGVKVASYGFAFLFFLGIELVLIRFHGRPLLALLSIGGLSAAALMLLFAIIMFSSVYIDPVGITVTAILLKLLHWAYDCIQPRHRPQTAWE
jgi:CHASE2 domain-containing sensor protein